MKRFKKYLSLAFLIMIVSSCSNNIKGTDAISAKDMEIGETISNQEVVVQHNQPNKEHNSLLKENPHYIEDVQNDAYNLKYSSEDDTIVVYVDNVDFSRTNSIEFAFEYDGDLWIESGRIYFMEKLADPDRDDIVSEQKSIQIDG